MDAFRKIFVNQIQIEAKNNNTAIIITKIEKPETVPFFFLFLNWPISSHDLPSAKSSKLISIVSELDTTIIIK